VSKAEQNSLSNMGDYYNYSLSRDILNDLLADVIKDRPFGADPNDIEIRAISTCERGKVFFMDRAAIATFGYSGPRYYLICHTEDEPALAEVLNDKRRVESSVVSMLDWNRFMYEQLKEWGTESEKDDA